MARKPRAPKKRIAGTYRIDTGTARIIEDPLRDGGYTLEVNNVPSSYVVLGAPEVLEYDYMEWIAGLMRGDAPFTSTHLGGAACTLASYFQQRWGGSHTAVEVDAALARLVRWAFEPAAPIVVAEARAYTHALAPGSQDVIVRDVFAGPATPRPLTTVEFYRAARTALAPGGIYAANVGDLPGLSQSSAELAGMAEVFAHIGVVSTPDILAGRAYGNIVLAGSDTELPGERRAREIACGAAARRD
ncbi:spermidine synthase [Corynebacterium liangguodongii]|uniref:Uncharacterized protein n=1 Tax=Corynebacterium liangguodongii TaxID=2079535 RepID=A0A2S0WDD4_9CORY|nr:fused MFS/spermidine synthase [Corynebacterium liangguodongii]AWB83760.1 hypothetical protein C3E79_04050 [Corynebacterium liangguodongii]PWB99430.1 hypothetical protein DF219_05745 [Corynebacterium liangguodongii]